MGEWFNFPENSKLLRHLPNLGNKPLVVLTHDPKALKPGGLVSQWESLTEPIWQQLQVDLATISTNSKHIVVDQAGHNIQFEKPDVVVEAILDVVEEARARSRR